MPFSMFDVPETQPATLPVALPQETTLTTTTETPHPEMDGTPPTKPK